MGQTSPHTSVLNDGKGLIQNCNLLNSNGKEGNQKRFGRFVCLFIHSFIIYMAVQKATVLWMV